jgi:peroxiredoxin
VPSFYDVAHLVGLPLPAIDAATEDLASFPADVASFAREGPLVIHTFPGIDWWVDAPQVSDEDAAQAGDFREHRSEFADLGYRILAITTLPVGELHRWVRREKIRYFLASDEELSFAEALALPTERLERLHGYKRPPQQRARVYRRLMAES